MNSELTLWDQPISPVQTTFNWDETFAETKKLVEEDAELTATIDDAMVKRFHGRVKIGFNLMALQAEHAKLGHGDFTTTVLPDLGIDKRFAYRCISVGKLYQQNSFVTNLSQTVFDLPMPMDTWHKLASPSGQTVVKQLESGEIQPTQEDIKKALEEEKAKAAAEKQRAEQLKQDLEAEQKAHSLFKDEVKANEQAYTALVESLEQQVQQLENKPAPEPQKIIEYQRIIEYQDTLETAAKVASLEQQVKALEAKPNISPEKQKELENLQLELENAKTELGFYTTQNEALAKEINEHREAAGRSLEDATALAGRLRIRQVWQYATDEIQASLRKFHTRVPSEIDRESFEGEEHTRTYQTIEILEQTITFLRGTLPQATSSIVDESEAPIAFIEASKPQQPVTTNVDPAKLFEQYRDFVKSLANDTLWWRAPDSGIMDMEMTKDEHIQYTRQMLKNGEEFDDPYRIGCAVEGMKRTLGVLK